MRRASIGAVVGAVMFSIPAGAFVADDSYYRVAVYTGPPHYPDFKGKQRNWNSYRTRLRAAVTEGVRFGGKYGVAVWGCGTHCVQTVLVDISTGEIIPWLRGGEDMYVEIKHMRPDSSLARTTWDGSGKCYEEAVRINDGHLSVVEMNEVEPHVCPGLYVPNEGVRSNLLKNFPSAR